MIGGGSLAALPGLVVPILERRPGFVVVAKPAGLVVHHNDRSRRGSLALLQILRDQLGVQLNPVHRLDAGTSGCLIFAEDAATTAMLQRALSSDGAQKTYYAMVRGNAASALGEPLTVARAVSDDKGVRRTAATELWCPASCCADDLPAHVNATAASSCNLASSLVVAKPKTGRWHQIRKHLNGLSHPILNDATHGDSRVRMSPSTWRPLTRTAPWRAAARSVRRFHGVPCGSASQCGGGAGCWGVKTTAAREKRMIPSIITRALFLACRHRIQPRSALLALNASTAPVHARAVQVNRWWREQYGLRQLGLHCAEIRLPLETGGTLHVRPLRPARPALSEQRAASPHGRPPKDARSLRLSFRGRDCAACAGSQPRPPRLMHASSRGELVVVCAHASSAHSVQAVLLSGAARHTLSGQARVP